jgi:outer membrane protein assembly factor BamA
MPLKYYGIGPDTQKDKYEIVKGEFLLFKQRFLREFKPSFYTGLELDFQRMSNVDFPSTHSSTVDKPVGSSGSTNLGVGWGLLYNNIHNAMNPRRGFFSEWAFLSYNENIGSEFNLSSFIIDNRIYIPSGKRNVFAAQLYGQFTTGNAPFNLVSLLGGENLMRGYYSGRYRDDHLLAAQLEYRLLPFPFSKRIGGSMFMAFGQVFSETNKFQWQNFLPTAGGGLRFLIFPEKDIYTRLDFAFTQEGSGVYFLIGEAF